MQTEVFNFLDSKKLRVNREYVKRIEYLKAYFANFFQKYPQNDLNKIINMPEKEILIAAIILSNPLKIPEILDTLEKYPDIFKNDEYTHLLGGLALYYHDEEVRNLVKKCTSINPLIYIPATIDLGNIMKSIGLNPTECNIPGFFEDNPNAKKDLEIVFKTLDPEFHNTACYLVDGIRRYNESDEFDDEKAFLDTLSREGKREYKKIVGVTDKKEFMQKRIRTYYNFLNTKFKEIIKASEKKEKEALKHNDNIENLKKLLDTDTEIRNIDAIMKLCSTDEIKEKVAHYIYLHNKSVYEKLIKSYEKARQNSDENLNKLFKKYGFNYDILNAKDKINLKNQSFEDIENLLKRLSSLKVYQVNVSHVSLFKLSTIEELVGKGLITEAWLQENVELLLNDNNLLDLVVTNINILSKEGINMLRYSNSLDITKSTILPFNLNLLRQYGLSITKNTTDINFLDSQDLRIKIEFIYSLGVSEEDLSILNNSIVELLKIKIANSLNVPSDAITDLNELYYDFTPEVIPQDYLEKLAQDSEFTTNLPRVLDSYRFDNNTLNINGIYVAIEKIEHNLLKIGDNSLEACFYAIIYQGFYTYEELEILQKALIPEQDLFKKVRS